MFFFFMWFLLHCTVKECVRKGQKKIYCVFTSLQKLLGLPSLETVLNPAEVSSHFIMYNMTKVNKHGVVTLDDKTGKKIFVIIKYHCLRMVILIMFFKWFNVNYMTHWFYSQRICPTGFCQLWNVSQTVSMNVKSVWNL